MTIALDSTAIIYVIISLLLIPILYFIHKQTRNKILTAVCTYVILLDIGLVTVTFSLFAGEVFFKYVLNYNIIESNSITSSDAMIAILTAIVGPVFAYMFYER